MRRLAQTILILATSAGSAAAAPGAALKSTTPGGGGCPAGVAARLADDGTSLTLDLTGLGAETAAPRRFARKHCEVIVELKHAPGWQVTAVGAQLEAEGTGGDVTVQAYQQGQRDTATAKVRPKSGAPTKETVQLTPAWSACGDHATLVAGAAAKVDQPGGKVRLAGPLHLTLAWRECRP